MVAQALVLMVASLFWVSCTSASLKTPLRAERAPATWESAESSEPATQPSEPTDCFGKFFAQNPWKELTVTQVQCVQSNEIAQKGFAYLCNADQKDFSPVYKSYLSYEARYQAAVQRLKEATTSAERRVAQGEMLKADQEWQLRGYKSDVSERLNVLFQVRAACTP